MYMIEKEIRLAFEKECKHEPLRLKVEKASKKTTRGASSSRAPPPSRPSSPTVSFLKSIFTICHHNATEVCENKRRTKKITHMIKEDHRAQGRECSPDGSECDTDNGPLEFENPFEIYEAAQAHYHGSSSAHAQVDGEEEAGDMESEEDEDFNE